MNTKIFKNAGLLLLAIVFSIGLMFAFTELPRLLDQLIQSFIQTPHSDPAYDNLKIEVFYSAYSIRLLGYICLGLIIGFIILGFTTRKTAWAWVGGIAFFLPVFATFANSMFYLAGLGLFNIIFFPLQDFSLSLIDLGKVTLVPYWILIWAAKLFNWNAHHFLVYFFMISGTLIFVLGVFAWLQTRFKKDKIAKHWIYKYSRHPQYLGWIIWSYGLMLYGPSLNNMKKSWGWYGTLPFLLSTLIIIGICMLEELKMKEISGSEYDEYRKRTPFLFPIPGFIKWILKAPMRLFYKKERPEKRKEVGLLITIYAALLMAISLFWFDFSSLQKNEIAEIKPYDQEVVEMLVENIRKPIHRRYRSTEPYRELLSIGEQSHEAFFELMNDPNPDVKQFAMQAASENNVRKVIPHLITAMNDPIPGIAQTAIFCLGDLRATEAADTIFAFLEHPREGIRYDVMLTALGKIGDIRIFPYLEKELDSDAWYKCTGAMRNMMLIDMERAKPFIYEALGDERTEVRREAVGMLLEALPEDAIPHLQKVTHDENWDIRFYAKQAIKMIQKKK